MGSDLRVWELMNIDDLSDHQLLELHCRLMARLRARGVVRSSNNPVGDYTETLVSQALNATLENNSRAGYDAISRDGARIQIKGRRLTKENGSTQLSALRNLAANPFDSLAAVLFDESLQIRYAALIPLEVVQKLAVYRAHTNAHVVHFRPGVLEIAGVRDITAEVRAAALQSR